MNATDENSRRSGFRDEQSKPKTGKKGKRGQAEGRNSKSGVTQKVTNNRKKPGRQKQTVDTVREAAKKARSGKKS